MRKIRVSMVAIILAVALVGCESKETNVEIKDSTATEVREIVTSEDLEWVEEVKQETEWVEEVAE